MPPRRTYGTKRPTSSAATAAIFGRSPPPAPLTSPPSHPASSTRDPLGELSSNLGALLLEETPVSSQPELEPEPEPESEPELLPLLRTLNISPQSWGSVLSSADTTLEKIAEASYAEVYRATNASGTSILKVMQVKVSTDPASDDTPSACAVEGLVSELSIMNVLTEVPGFVLYKEAHLIRGTPLLQIKQAWDSWVETSGKPSLFPDPESFGPTSTFLVIELGDAGKELDQVPMEHIEQVWDVLLGVIIALARAEESHEFEHRDLHESNICVLQTGPLNPFAATRPARKFGFSGLETTIIDYGLSRAKIPKPPKSPNDSNTSKSFDPSNFTIAFNDLETQDLFTSQGTTPDEKMQFDNYRRMRTFLATGSRLMSAAYVDGDSSMHGHSWSEFIPYTNVLWIRYLLFYLEHDLKKHGDKKALEEFKSDTKDFKSKLNPRTTPWNGAFVNARQVLEFCVKAGWVTERQLSQE
ncbi:hypothetical protein L207DRAFT_346723 [Hyaloscypha variabilis F]|uniref:non-specific serine/threonine protein kinase n=1 Tax=Hyaloscypha variabilis (strain UAMH 11265 / GT02V1 / F) TaxID=1149755 RepID=A0A2J6RQR7_HYAVF|nr:hypothetical protein L207DRAFT_346723 [Hyaloscypha variabilis F]